MPEKTNDEPMKQRVENPLFPLYEKLYFHEIEVREKLGGRLQTPLAVIISILGAIVYLVQNCERQFASTPSYAFLFLLSGGAAAILAAVYFFVRSWYGYTYTFLPTPEDSENYRLLLEKTYKEYQEGQSLADRALSDYLCRYYIDCASKNTRCNDQRSLRLHRTNSCIIISATMIASSFLVFTFGKLAQVKPVEVSIIQPLEIKGNLMTVSAVDSPKGPPPSPPSPPPPRIIKEGVEITKATTKGKQHGK
jgi:hypothetical protein